MCASNLGSQPENCIMDSHVNDSDDSDDKIDDSAVAPSA